MSSSKCTSRQRGWSYSPDSDSPVAVVVAAAAELDSPPHLQVVLNGALRLRGRETTRPAGARKTSSKWHHLPPPVALTTQTGGSVSIRHAQLAAVARQASCEFMATGLWIAEGRTEWGKAGRKADSHQLGMARTDEACMPVQCRALLSPAGRCASPDRITDWAGVTNCSSNRC